jgi:hypothetical protein
MGNEYVISLAASGNNIFAGIYMGGGLYLSTDNGTTWTQTSLNNQSVPSLAVSGNDIFAGTSQYGVYKSTNNGANWIQTSLNNLYVFSLAVNGNNIFAGGGYPGPGAYLSTNNGANWTLSLTNEYVSSLAVNENSVYAGTQNHGVYLSTNNGTNWTQTSLNIQFVPSLAASGNNIFAGTGNGVYVSNDNGANWTQRNEGLGNIVVHVFCIINNYIFAGTDGNSVYRRPLSELIGIQPISNVVPNQFSLSQNYPNPFNPTTKIQFALPKSSFAKIVVYDALGRDMETLVNEQLNTGTYEAEWNASNYPSGVYYYKLTAGDYMETKKMMLLK